MRVSSFQNWAHRSFSQAFILSSLSALQSVAESYLMSEHDNITVGTDSEESTSTPRTGDSVASTAHQSRFFGLNASIEEETNASTASIFQKKIEIEKEISSFSKIVCDHKV